MQTVHADLKHRWFSWSEICDNLQAKEKIGHSAWGVQRT